MTQPVRPVTVDPSAPVRQDEAQVHAEPAWTPTHRAEERIWRRQLDDEVRPLLDSLRRLRERGLLD